MAPGTGVRIDEHLVGVVRLDRELIAVLELGVETSAVLPRLEVAGAVDEYWRPASQVNLRTRRMLRGRGLKRTCAHTSA